jgi:hypothetical protein
MCLDSFFSGSDSGLIVYPVSGTLEIARVHARHAGAYKCEAKNADKSRTSREGRLIVDEPVDGMCVCVGAH